MIRSSLATVVVACLLFAGSAALAQNTVAITEFFSNPGGTDNAREWMEFFNYGTMSVDLTNWTLTDEDGDVFTFGSVTIAPGGYLILTSAIVAVVGGTDDLTPERAKQVFEEEWLGGVADSRVIGFEGMALGNRPDEIILSDDSGRVVWSLAYHGGAKKHLTVFHTSARLWNIDNTYGTKKMPGVDRSGDDNNITGFLGYEYSADGFDKKTNTATNPNDAYAFLSNPTNLNTLFGPSGSVFIGPDFSDAKPGFGSPLAGGYRVN